MYNKSWFDEYLPVAIDSGYHYMPLFIILVFLPLLEWRW